MQLRRLCGDGKKIYHPAIPIGGRRQHPGKQKEMGSPVRFATLRASCESGEYRETNEAAERMPLSRSIKSDMVNTVATRCRDPA
jgi:hypothetical protein